jgi:Helix-turn-helix domain
MNGLRDFDLLTLSEVAELLHCSKAHVSRVVAGLVQGCPPIPAVPLGRRKLVRRKSLLAWIERNEHAAANDNALPAANDNRQASLLRSARGARDARKAG